MVAREAQRIAAQDTERLATERSTTGTTDTESWGWNTEPHIVKILAVACWDCFEIREAARLLCISLTHAARGRV